MKCLLLLFTLLTIAISSFGRQAKQEKDSLEINSNVRIYKNIRYALPPDSFQNDTSSDRKLNLYLPSFSTSKKHPVLLFIHGGGFSSGDKEQMDVLCTKISSFGYAVVSINYRLELKRVKTTGVFTASNMSKDNSERINFHPSLSKALVSASKDAELALLWIKENAPIYSLNTNSLAISGGSAGAMTALHTAYVSNQKILPIRAVVNLWGGLENVKEIRKGAPPVITYHGQQDDIINVGFANAISERMKSIGNIQSEIHILEGKKHGRYDIILKEKVSDIDEFLRKVFSGTQTNLTE